MTLNLQPPYKFCSCRLGGRELLNECQNRIGMQDKWSRIGTFCTSIGARALSLYAILLLWNWQTEHADSPQHRMGKMA